MFYPLQNTLRLQSGKVKARTEEIRKIWGRESDHIGKTKKGTRPNIKRRKLLGRKERRGHHKVCQNYDANHQEDLQKSKVGINMSAISKESQHRQQQYRALKAYSDNAQKTKRNIIHDKYPEKQLGRTNV